MWICPVCNGFDSLFQLCPHCHSPLVDMGRLSDYYNPYSPYREIEQVKLTSGEIDGANHLCLHLLSCTHCDQQLVQKVVEEQFPQLPGE